MLMHNTQVNIHLMDAAKSSYENTPVGIYHTSSHF